MINTPILNSLRKNSNISSKSNHKRNTLDSIEIINVNTTDNSPNNILNCKFNNFSSADNTNSKQNKKSKFTRSIICGENLLKVNKEEEKEKKYINTYLQSYKNDIISKKDCITNNLDSNNNTNNILNIIKNSNCKENKSVNRRYSKTNIYNNKINEESDSDDNNTLSISQSKSTLKINSLRNFNSNEYEINPKDIDKTTKIPQKMFVENIEVFSNFMLNNDNDKTSLNIEIFKIKIYFLIPENKVFSKVIKESNNSTCNPSKYTNTSFNIINNNANTENKINYNIKNGYLIKDIVVSIDSNKIVDDLISLVLYKINTLLNKEDIMIKFNDEDNSLYTLRTSKKSGFPDFDMPSKIKNI